MSKFTKCLALALCMICYLSYAQKFELGKVSIAELEEKQHPKDPSAAAAVLFEKGQVRFDYTQADGFEMVLEVTTRIKIYNKEGYDHANASVRYYNNGSSREKLSFSDVATYNLVNGKIEKTKMKSDGSFDVKINKYWGSTKIALPNVKEGSVIEYSYVLHSPRIGKFSDWNFQSDIPVNYSEFETDIPEYFIYNVNQRGYLFPKVTSVKSDKSINYMHRDENEPGGTIIHSTTQERLNFTETKTTYLAENMPALKDESYVNNIRNYTSGISHELSIVKFPSQPIKSYSTDWETVTKEIYNYDDFGPELDKTGYFENDIKAVIKDAGDRDMMISNIFNYVKSNINWNDYYGYSCDDGVRAAYKNKSGNVAEINLMLTAMLRFAGLEANPVLVSTRSNGIAFFPNRTAFNYVVAAVETPQGLILLDATEKYALPNVLPLRALNWYGRLIRKDGTSIEVNMMPEKLSRQVNYMSAVIKADNSVEGKIRKQYFDYKAMEYRKKAFGINKDAFVEDLENSNNAIEIGDYVRDNDQDLSKPVIESFSYKDTHGIEVINGKMYVSPMLFLAGTENPFTQEKREYPVDFSYPSEIKYNISFELPQGYAVESLPKPINLTTGDNIGNFKYNIANTDNKIQIAIVSSINAAIVPSDYYETLKDFYQKMIEKETEKIIVVKS